MTVTTLMTAEELLAMPDDGVRHELVQGELRSMSPAGAKHGRIVMIIARELDQFVSSNGFGWVYNSDTGFVLSRNPDTVRCPDVPFVRQERRVRADGFFEGAPDLAVEVISPTDRYSEVREKVQEYLRAGTQLVIVVDPRTQGATLYTPTGGRDLTIDDSLHAGDVVPGWSLPLRELFA